MKGKGFTYLKVVEVTIIVDGILVTSLQHNALTIPVDSRSRIGRDGGLQT